MSHETTPTTQFVSVWHQARWKPYIIGSAIALSLIGTGVILLRWWIKTPSQGVIYQGTLPSPSPSPLPKSVETECFSLTVPPGIFNPRTESLPERCTLRAGLTQPKGLMTISVEKPKPDQRFADHTGLTLRLKGSDVYQKISLPWTIAFPHQAFITNNELTIFIDHPTGVVVISLNELVLSSPLHAQLDSRVAQLAETLWTSLTFPNIPSNTEASNF